MEEYLKENTSLDETLESYKENKIPEKHGKDALLSVLNTKLDNKGKLLHNQANSSILDQDNWRLCTIVKACWRDLFHLTLISLSHYFIIKIRLNKFR